MNFGQNMRAHIASHDAKRRDVHDTRKTKLETELRDARIKLVAMLGRDPTVSRITVQNARYEVERLETQLVEHIQNAASGGKSRRRKSHRRKSHRRKSHRRKSHKRKGTRRRRRR
jgi:hypothetical protein